MTGGESTLHQEIRTLYLDHHGWLCNFLRKKLGNSFDAADLAHDTFMRVLASYRQAPPPTLREPRAYLTTVAKRLLVNYYERQSLERAYAESLRLMPETLAPSVEERAILLETLHELDALLDALPPKARTAFLLSQLEGLTYEEIAAQLQISTRTVTRYMAQGFRQCLSLMLTQAT